MSQKAATVVYSWGALGISFRITVVVTPPPVIVNAAATVVHFWDTLWILFSITVVVKPPQVSETEQSQLYTPGVLLGFHLGKQ